MPQTNTLLVWLYNMLVVSIQPLLSWCDTCRHIQEQHNAWEGFDAAAMWVELDRLEAAAAAARAAKTQLEGKH